MNILIFSFDSNLHGYNTFASTLINNLRNRNLKISRYVLLEKTRTKSVFYIPGSRVFFKPILAKLYLLYLIVRNLHAEISKKDYDVILLLSFKGFISVLILKTLFFRKLKIVVSLQNTTKIFEDYLKGKLRFRRRISLKLLFYFFCADKIVTCSRGIASEIKKLYPLSENKCAFIYNGIDSKLIKTKSLTELTIGKIRLISIGRLRKQKDFPTLLKAFYLVLKKHQNTELLIIGTGPEYANLVMLTKKIKIDRHVRFLPATPNPFYYLRHSDIYLQTSIYEGFGYALVEAMALGLPVISTDCPYGPKEITKNGQYGFLTKVGDDKEIANQVIKLISDRDLYNLYSKRARERVKFFSSEKMVRQYEKLFFSIQN